MVVAWPNVQEGKIHRSTLTGEFTHDLVSEDVMHSTHTLHMEASFKHRHREGGYTWFLAIPLSCSSKQIRVQVCRIVVAHFV